MKSGFFCERVLVDLSTGLYSAVNIFDNIIIYDDHALVAPYRLYVELTGGSGQFLIAVEIQELEESMLLGKEERAITLTARSEKLVKSMQIDRESSPPECLARTSQAGPATVMP